MPDYRGFAPRHPRDTISTTLAAAIQRVRDTTGEDGTIVAHIHPDALAGLTSPLGVVLITNRHTPRQNVWISLPDNRPFCRECGEVLTDSALTVCTVCNVWIEREA